MNAAPPEQKGFGRPVRKEDLSFARNARLAIRGDRMVGANLILLTIISLLAASLYWASQANIDEVTKGQGKVIPSTSIQTVQNLEGGIVAEIFVREGERVEKDDVLIRIDDTLSSSSYRENLAKYEALQAQLVRLQSESQELPGLEFPEELVKKRPDLVARETDLFEKRETEREEQREILLRSLQLASEELTMTIPLVQKGVLSKVEQLRLEREVIEIEGELKELTGGFEQDAMEQFNQTKAEYESLAEVVQWREDRVNRTLVRAPTAGTVNKIYMNTIGGVVQPGEPIADIVPDDDTLLVEAKICPSDIAFLRPGQEAVLKFSAYDFAIYGGLEGKVENISADTIEDEIDQQHYYMIKVRNAEGRLMKDGEEYPIIPGMVVQVDVITGRRTVLQYLFKPFHRMRFNALRER